MSKKTKKKRLFFVGILEVPEERAGSGSAFVIQWYGFPGFPDPDPYQNVTDPQHS
jgi:hypothetical protein